MKSKLKSKSKPHLLFFKNWIKDFIFFWNEKIEINLIFKKQLKLEVLHKNQEPPNNGSYIYSLEEVREMFYTSIS
jgi:hypothetical protein